MVRSYGRQKNLDLWKGVFLPSMVESTLELSKEIFFAWTWSTAKQFGRLASVPTRIPHLQCRMVLFTRRLKMALCIASDNLTENLFGSFAPKVRATASGEVRS